MHGVSGVAGQCWGRGGGGASFIFTRYPQQTVLGQVHVLPHHHHPPTRGATIAGDIVRVLVIHGGSREAIINNMGELCPGVAVHGVIDPQLH